MNTFQRMNKAINYIEEHLTDEIDYKEAARIAVCPISLFQRFFVYITNITLSEYIRRRRLTLCAFELQKNNSKIIDIAVKYGYDSHSSFSRAFRMFHGISPRKASERGTVFNIYPKIYFPEEALNFDFEKGVNIMNENRDFKVFEELRYRFDIIELEQSLKFAGLSTKGDFSKIGVYHENFASAVNDKMIPYTEIALWENMTSENSEYDYIYGALVTSLENIPKGLVGADTGFTKFAVMTVKCDTLDDLFGDVIIRKAHHNFGKLMPPEYADQMCSPHSKLTDTRGFGTLGEVKPGNVSLIEIYPCDLFEKIEMCFYIPLKK